LFCLHYNKVFLFRFLLLLDIISSYEFECWDSWTSECWEVYFV
jgi:hypothetical protein